MCESHAADVNVLSNVSNVRLGADFVLQIKLPGSGIKTGKILVGLAVSHRSAA